MNIRKILLRKFYRLSLNWVCCLAESRPVLNISWWCSDDAAGCSTAPTPPPSLTQPPWSVSPLTARRFRCPEWTTTAGRCWRTRGVSWRLAAVWPPWGSAPTAREDCWTTRASSLRAVAMSWTSGIRYVAMSCGNVAMSCDNVLDKWDQVLHWQVFFWWKALQENEMKTNV